MYKAFIMLTQCAATDNIKRGDLFFFFFYRKEYSGSFHVNEHLKNYTI